MNNVHEIKLLEDIEKELNKPDFSSIVKKLETNDFQTQTFLYHDMLQVEATKLADQLRHRANMMRDRAREFDERADFIEKVRNDLSRSTVDFCQHNEETLNILAEHAHIKPTRVTGEDG